MTVELHLGDCLEYMRTMPDKSVDLCLTDPPYGIGIASNPFRQKFKKLDWDNLPANSFQIKEMFRVSHNQVVWGGNYFDLPPTQCFYIWNKKQPENFSSSMVEMAWTSYSKPAKMFSFSVTSYAKEHPTQKPLELMEWIISRNTKEGEMVFDPFMGSGTTGVAAVQLGRSFIGCEMNPEYFAIAERRIKQAQEARQLELV